MRDTRAARCLRRGTSPFATLRGRQVKDATGLYYYNARYYDPALGRFIQPDTIVPDPANPQSLNRYAHVLNNPLKYTDPTGHFAWIIAGGVAGASIAGSGHR